MWVALMMDNKNQNIEGCYRIIDVNAVGNILKACSF